MKNCFKCGLKKEKYEFYRHRMMRDGFLGKCKDCTQKDVRENRHRNRDYYNKYDSARSAKGYHVRRKWSIKNKGVLKAHRIMRKALSMGSLLKIPCEILRRFKF